MIIQLNLECQEDMCYTAGHGRGKQAISGKDRTGALSDPIRLQILDILVKGRDVSCVSSTHPQLPQAICPYLDVQPKLENISTSKLSYHLKELREAGLVEEHCLGKQVFYLVNQRTLKQLLEMVKAHYLYV